MTSLEKYFYDISGGAPIYFYSGSITDTSWATQITPNTDKKIQLVYLHANLDTTTAQLNVGLFDTGSANPDTWLLQAYQSNTIIRPILMDFRGCPPYVEKNWLLKAKVANASHAGWFTCAYYEVD